MEKIAPCGYLSRNEYFDRLQIIQEQIYLSLLQNDVRFGGSDSIEAVMVFGSYAQGIFQEGNSRVRKPYGKNPGSDLDIITFESNIGIQPPLTTLNAFDLELAQEIKPFPIEDWVKIPQRRLTYLLRRNLRAAGLNIGVDKPSLEIVLDYPAKTEAQLLGDQGSPVFRIKSGLLFVPETQGAHKVFEIAQRSKLPIIWNPATDAKPLHAL